MSGYAGALLTLLAINVVFAYGTFLPMSAGQLNLGAAGFIAVGAYTSAFLSNSGAPLYISIPCAALCAGVLALIVSIPVLRTRGIYLALATFALGQVVQATFLNIPLFGGAAGYPVIEHINSLVIVCTAALVFAVSALIFATRFGISVVAIHDDERVADLMGLNTRAFQATAFALGAAVAGVGGALYAHHYSFIEAQQFGFGLSITAVLYVIFGGTQTIVGPLVGAAAFTLLPEIARASQEWRYVLFASVIVCMMAVRPQGLVTRASLRRLFEGRARG